MARARAPQVIALGNNQYVTTVNGHTMHFSGQPGSSAVVGGVRVTLPPNPAQPGAGAQPYLKADEQLDFNNQMNKINLDDLDLGAAHDQAHTNYERTIADLAHNALVSAQSVEENMAARGQFDSGVRDSGLIDVEQHRALSAARSAEDLRAADILYETKHQALNTARGQLQNWYTTTAGSNAANSRSEAAAVVPTTYNPNPNSRAAAPNRTAPPPVRPTQTAIKVPTLTPGQRALAGKSPNQPAGGNWRPQGTRR